MPFLHQPEDNQQALHEFGIKQLPVATGLSSIRSNHFDLTRRECFWRQRQRWRQLLAFQQDGDLPVSNTQLIRKIKDRRFFDEQRERRRCNEYEECAKHEGGIA